MANGGSIATSVKTLLTLRLLEPSGQDVAAAGGSGAIDVSAISFTGRATVAVG